MNKYQLKAFQAEIRNLREALEPVLKHWEDPMTEVIGVLLQNMGANAEGCHGCTHEGELKRVQSAKAAILSLCSYNEYHLTDFIKQEIELTEISAYHLED